MKWQPKFNMCADNKTIPYINKTEFWIPRWWDRNPLQATVGYTAGRKKEI